MRNLWYNNFGKILFIHRDRLRFVEFIDDAVTHTFFMLQTNAGVARAMRVDRVTGRPRSVATETVGEKFPTVRPDFDPAD